MQYIVRIFKFDLNPFIILNNRNIVCEELAIRERRNFLNKTSINDKL